MRNTREAVARFSVWKCDFLISLKHISWEALSRELLTKQTLNQFLKKNTKIHFEQKLKARKYKITFKNIQNTQKKIWVWSTSTWAYTSHLNMYNHTNEISIIWTKSCVLWVSIKYGIVLRPEWSFNDQFNQVIHNWY